MRRWLAPAILTLASVILAVLADGWSSAAATVPFEVSRPPPPAPVLSARRIPGLLTGLVAHDRLNRALDAVVSDHVLGSGADSCVLVSQGGETLYARNRDVGMVPASTLKLLTATAIGDNFDPAERFQTVARATAHPIGGVLDGDLWLVGSGDPLIETDDYSQFNSKTFHLRPHIHTAFEKLADAIVAAGVHEITGAVVGDESRFDTVRYVPSWRPIYISDGEAGPASALEVNDGFTKFEPKLVATDRPATYAAQVLTVLLSRRGVKVAGPAREGSAPPASAALAALSSPTIGEIVTEMLQESDNSTAELLVKELGRRKAGLGSTSAGLRVMTETLRRLGLPLTGVVTLDGSGLDRGDRATCSALMAVLNRAGPDSMLARSLSVAGESGTLVNRFVGTPISGHLRAKTGSIDFVAALSGFVTVRPGPPVVFAMIANGLPKPYVVTQHLQDALVTALATYPDAPTADSLAP